MIVLPAKLDIDTKEAEKDLKDMKGTLNKLFEVEKYEQFAGWMGDLRDVFDTVSTSLLGMTEAEAKAASEGAYLAEKGIVLGAAFGPLGAAIGGVTGALLGWVNASKEAAKAEAELTAKMSEESRLREEIRIKEMEQQKKLQTETAFNLAQGFLDFQDFKDQYLETFDAVLDADAKGIASSKEVSDALAKRKLSLDDVETAYWDLIDAQEQGYEDRIAEATQALALAYRVANRDLAGLNKALNEWEGRGSGVVRATEKIDESITITIGSMEHLIHVLGGLDTEDPGDSALGQLQRDASAAADALQRLEGFELPALKVSDSTKALDEAADSYRNYLDAVSGGLSEFTSQLEDNIAAGEAALSGMGIAAEAAVASILKALGKEWGAKAISELAAGFAALSTPGFSFLAAGHFKSAGLYGAAAVAAGVGGAVLGGDASRRESARSEASSGASDGFASSSAARMDSGPQDLRPIVVNFDSTIPATEREAQQVADRLRKLMGGRR